MSSPDSCFFSKAISSSIVDVSKGISPRGGVATEEVLFSDLDGSAESDLGESAREVLGSSEAQAFGSGMEVK